MDWEFFSLVQKYSIYFLIARIEQLISSIVALIEIQVFDLCVCWNLSSMKDHNSRPICIVIYELGWEIQNLGARKSWQQEQKGRSIYNYYPQVWLLRQNKKDKRWRIYKYHYKTRTTFRLWRLHFRRMHMSLIARSTTCCSAMQRKETHIQKQSNPSFM